MYQLVRALLIPTLVIGFAGGPSLVATNRLYFDPVLQAGAGIANVYSIATNLQVNGYDASTRRNSGTSQYVVQSQANGELRLREIDVYDGAPPSHAITTIADGGMEVCFNHECRVNTDASGPVFNKLLWGTPPSRLSPGTTWQVVIDRPWELGPAATQIVTVISADEKSGTITVKREGSGGGFWANEKPKTTLSRNGKTVSVAVTPGTTTWSGLTTFRRGLVVSDELVAVRTDTLTENSGRANTGVRRRYILLNAAPFPLPMAGSTDVPSAS